ncbi:fructose-bisphosphate aldolase [Flavobacterium noncentrifugens]|uniref:fructose-bisphosphate aldolase n=1 Tax=Flavobacterium noncentrifugens TaxID=1128970 RepID=A0A1G8WYK6_9FLAO|nr:class I fructose-bisphosphate aldolase [Flavobacterium noncentrifugens]GEP51096.1 fructose-bisphosphate aldolase [Flavobacterium noncentrifugens]SDJ83303.1 fructose-bisphosphate aldolase, class I [Flavobacterium noncentrifugens]
MKNISKLLELLGDQSGDLLSHQCKAIPKESLQLPGASYLDDIFIPSNRSAQSIRSLNQIYRHGVLGGSGYLSILPVDQGVEHTAGSSFSRNPIYFDPENIIKLAIASGCNAVASTMGAMAMVSRKYAHKIPFIVKINHNELLTYPNKYDQIMFASVRDAWNIGAVAIGATVFFGSPESDRQIIEVANAFEEAHNLGMATVLWCYSRNPAFIKNGVDYNTAADITGQANYLGVTIQADIIKQKLPECNGGFTAIAFAKSNPDMYSELCTDHPIDRCRYQVLNCFSGRINMLNSGGESKGATDMAQALRTAIINKRAGGAGIIMGRKSFERPFKEGVELIQAVQEIYLSEEITIA